MKQKETKGDSVSRSMIFKTMERYIVMSFQLVVQIVIARILSPEDYGVVAMMTVFISIATIFINNGFNMAVVQKKDADNVDYATAFTINILIGISLYLILFLSSGLIADFYEQPLIKVYLPVLGLLLVFGSLNSIQMAIANRNMLFKNLLKCNVTASLLSGIFGVVAAYLGMGVWSLIIQQLSSSIILSIMLFMQQHWMPRFVINRESAKSMFSFGWKLLAAGLINQVYNELNSLVIGKKYTSGDLAFYTKGNQFPHFLTSGLEGAIGTVIFSALSKKQNDYAKLHALMRKSMVTNSYLIFPALAILGMVATPLTEILLTEKWLPLVPFMQICCFTRAFHPVASVQMQSLSAVGRSDMRLKLEFIKKGIGISLLLLAVNYGPFAIAVSAAISSIISIMLGAIACKSAVRYSYTNTIRVLMPITLITLVSIVSMYTISILVTELNSYFQVVVVSLVGFVIYFGISLLTHTEGFELLKSRLLTSSKK